MIALLLAIAAQAVSPEVSVAPDPGAPSVRERVRSYRVAHEAAIMNDEPFGPVAVSRPFDTFEEAIAQANRLPFGLAAFAFTENGRRANLIGDLVESGMVGINTFAISGADTPFGGVKDSGFGSEGGKEGLESYQVVKAIHQA